MANLFGYRRYIIVILLAITIVISPYVANNVVEQRRQLEAEQLLVECPSWIRLLPEDEESERVILDKLYLLSHFDVKILRACIINGYNRHTSHYDRRLFDSKVFLLHRYYFAVPDKVPIETPHYGAWAAPIPGDPLHRNPMWPLSLNNENRLIIAGRVNASTGTIEYRSLEEFDYFHATYGLRHVQR